MLHTASRLRGSVVRATDGDIGTVDDLLFDDERWTIRYLVVATGSWLDRRVLISPLAVEKSWVPEGVSVKITREQVRRSPDADTYQPVSRQVESEVLRYYGYPYYWGGPGIWGAYDYPAALLGAAPEAVPPPEPTEPADPHLRSVAEVTGYHIHATDGEIGHVDDFLVDPRSWQIRYLQIDTSNWIGGKAVAVVPGVLKGVSASKRAVSVTVPRDIVKRSPSIDDVNLDPADTAPTFVLI